MTFRTDVRRCGSLFAVVTLLSAAAALWPAGAAEAAVSRWPLTTYELETDAEVRLTGCPDGWWHDGHQCLMYVPGGVSWSVAQAYCEDTQSGSTLASITDVFQMTKLLLKAKRAGQDQVWIGLSGQNDGDDTTWGWSDGTPLNFEAWEDGTGPEVGDAAEDGDGPGVGDGAEDGDGPEVGAGDGAGDGDGGDKPQLCAAFSTRKKSWRPVSCETKLRFFCGYILNDTNA